LRGGSRRPAWVRLLCVPATDFIGLQTDFPDARSPAEGADSVDSGSVDSGTWEKAAFEILVRIYREFGLPEAAIPFADLDRRRIDEAQLAGA